MMRDWIAPGLDRSLATGHCAPSRSKLTTVGGLRRGFGSYRLGSHRTPQNWIPTVKKLIPALGLALAAVATLSGCVGQAPDAAPGIESEELVVYPVDLPGNKVVDCVGSTYSTSVVYPDCDWDTVRDADAGSSQADSTLKSYRVVMEDGREVICVASRFTGEAVQPDCNWEGATKQ